MRERPDLQAVSDDKLLHGLFEILKQTRHDEADLIAHIAEVDARKLYAREAAPSMFAWCTDVLHLSEQEAYLRIAVARASREHHMLLAMLRDGRLHLSGIARLVPHLTLENRDAVLKRAAGMSHRQVKALVSELEPQPDAPARIRKLPERSAHTSGTDSPQLCAHRVEAPTPGLGAGGSAPAVQPGPARAGDPRRVLGPHDVQRLDMVPLVARTEMSRRRASPHPSTVEPRAPARYRVQFTASEEFRDKLERLQALMRSPVPDGDLATVIEVAVTEKLERLEARRFAKTEAPRKSLAETDVAPTSRHIPAAVRRAVHERDEGRCTFVSARGRRCGARDRLEFHHHDTPFGRGGDHSLTNVRLACRAHNLLLAEREFGVRKMARYRRAPGRVSETAAVYALGGRAGRDRVQPLPP